MPYFSVALGHCIIKVEDQSILGHMSWLERLNITVQAAIQCFLSSSALRIGRTWPIVTGFPEEPFCI